MTGDLKRLDPSDLAGRLRDRIRDSIADLIPDEQWDGMLEAEVTRFLRPKHSGSGFYSQTEPSDFTRIVQSEFERWARDKVRLYLTSPEWETRWDGQKMVLPETFERLIREALPSLLERVVTGMLAGTFRAAVGAAVDQMMRDDRG